MKNKFIFVFCNFFLNNFLLLKIKLKKYNNVDFNYDFQNETFEDFEELKKILFSKKYFIEPVYGEKNHHYHTFAWLKCAKKIGGAKIIAITKKHILNWHKKKYNLFSYVWSIESTSKRLVNLVFNFDFYAISANNFEKKFFKDLILKHYFILKLLMKLSNKDSESIEASKALLLIELIININIDNTFLLINNQIKNQVNLDGFHKSINPSIQAEYINDLHEIKNMCLYFKTKIPENVDHNISIMTSVLKNLFHKDHSLALFNSSNNHNKVSVIKVNNLYKDIKLKDLSKIKNGIAIYEINKLKLFFDITKPTNKLLSKDLHSGTLSFEMSYGNEKIITNCGSIEKRIGKKPEYLRCSAAHSTIILNNTNISELVEKKSYKRIPDTILLNCYENNEDFQWEGIHDGYKKNFNSIIKRKLIISKKSIKIIGQDIIIATKNQKKKNFFSIRFHITPLCNCLITNNKKSVLIRTKLNQSWIFESENKLSLEDSIYVNDGKTIHKTKQILISGYCSIPKKIIKWSLSKTV